MGISVSKWLVLNINKDKEEADKTFVMSTKYFSVLRREGQVYLLSFC
jgi:hypothetical protein